MREKRILGSARGAGTHQVDDVGLVGGNDYLWFSGCIAGCWNGVGG